MSGEMILTGPGSRPITIIVVDDDRAEGADEFCLVNASEGDDVARQTTWYAAEVRIIVNALVTHAPVAPTPIVVVAVG